MKKITVSLIIILAFFSAAGCKEKKPKKISVYTIWLGTAGFQIGNDTDNYKIEDGFIAFVSAKTGKTIVSPYENLFQIDINKTIHKNDNL